MKKYSKFLIILLLLLSFASVVYAKTTSDDQKTILRAPACPIYGSTHLFDNTSSYNEHEAQYVHAHEVRDSTGAIVDIYYDIYCKVYRVTEKWCDCGYPRTTKRTFSYSHCE